MKAAVIDGYGGSDRLQVREVRGAGGAGAGAGPPARAGGERQSASTG